MKPSTYQCVGEETLDSANSSTPVSATVPLGTSAIQITVESTSCRMSTSKAGDPTLATSGARIVQKDQQPWFMAIGQGVAIKFASTAGTASRIQIAYLQ